MTTMNQIIKNVSAGLVLSSLMACSDNDEKKSPRVSKEPWVMELHVVPTRITINPDKFYPKPFTVRAKYSNATVKNVSSQIKWVSENTHLLDVNEKGELTSTGKCDHVKCSVFLVGTDPVSGKSVRVTVFIKARVNAKAQKEQIKKKA